MDSDNENDYYCDEEEVIRGGISKPLKPEIKCECGSYFHKNYVYQRGPKEGEVLQSYLNKHLKGERHKKFVMKNEAKKVKLLS